MAFFLFHFFLNCAGIIGFQLHAAQNVFAAQQVCTGFHLHLNCALGGVDVEMVARVLAFAAVVFYTIVWAGRGKDIPLLLIVHSLGCFVNKKKTES